MNLRHPLSVLAFVALTAPLAAHADAPSGDFWDVFASSTKSAPSKERAETRNYVEVSIAELTGSDSAKAKTREDVRKELAASPMPHIEA